MLSQQISQKQTLSIAPKQLQALKLLAKNLPELRAELMEELVSNPAIEGVEHTLETPLSEVEREAGEREAEPDYPDDDFTPGANYDEEAAERRQAFFDNQVKAETLQEHLLAQLPLSDVPERDWPLVEVLVADLNDDGFYKGSVVDVQMAFGCTKDDVDRLLGAIMEFDPPGCGARTARECLLAQIDSLDGSPRQETVRKMVDSCLEDIAAGRGGKVAAQLGLDEGEYRAALAELRTLNPHPGRAFPGEKDRVEYVNPEVHAVEGEDGSWIALTDKRSLPEIRISKKFEQMLSDPAQTPETKAYVRERIASANAFREAIEKRQQTIEAIAQAIFDRQQEFFRKGFGAMRPLTELEIAREVGVSGPTVSRTVRDKYASTPYGTVELRRFFSSGVKMSDGVEVSQQAVLDRLKKLVEEEDASSPLSDEKLAEKLRQGGFAMARRTVAKYRDRLGIPGTAARRKAK